MSEKSNAPKFNFQGIVDNLKTMINPDAETPMPVDGDQLGKKLQSISLGLQELSEQHAQQTQNLNDLNHQVNELFNDIEQLRQQTNDVNPVAAATAAPKAEAQPAPAEESKPAAEEKPAEEDKPKEDN